MFIRFFYYVFICVIVCLLILMFILLNWICLVVRKYISSYESKLRGRLDFKVIGRVKI